MKYLNEEIEFEDLYYLRETLYNVVSIIETIFDKGTPAYEKASELKKELIQDIREAEDSFVDNNICSVCGGEIKPRIAYTGSGTDPFDRNYWPDEYDMICEDCGENYG